MKLLSNVLIKLARGGFTDRVLYLDNVPEEMFYEMKFPVHCVGKNNEQHYEPDMSKEKIPTLYPEIKDSLTGDKGLVFDLDNEHAKNRFLALDRFIKSVYPNNKLPAEPVIYSIDPSDPSSPAMALSQVPRVVLPVISPTAQAETGGTTASLDVEKIKREAVEAYQAEEQQRLKDRMAKARDARAIKQA